eukprot:3840646-Pleurochrysis_carterae.AAC.3
MQLHPTGLREAYARATNHGLVCTSITVSHRCSERAVVRAAVRAAVRAPVRVAVRAPVHSRLCVTAGGNDEANGSCKALIRARCYEKLYQKHRQVRAAKS